jgi:hypothetical protein
MDAHSFLKYVRELLKEKRTCDDVCPDECSLAKELRELLESVEDPEK